MSKEKIYFEEGNVLVSASRVVIDDQNFVLRNIAAVNVLPQKFGLIGKIVGVTLALFSLYLLASNGIMIKHNPIFSEAYTSFNWFPFIMLAVAGAIGYFAKDMYYVQVSSGGTPTNTLGTENPDLPTKVVDAINNAILDLDKNKESEKSNDESDGGTSATDEVMKLKGLLDAGAITQEEFDAKKKELLGL